MSTEETEQQESPFVAPEGTEPEPDTLTHPEGEPAITEEDAAERADDAPDFETIEGTDGDEAQETQTGEQPDQGAVEPGVAEAQLLSEREIEKRFGKLDSENARHRKRLGEILEEDALHIVPCPVCMESFHGWIFDPQHIPLEESQRDRTLQLLNLADFEDIPQASWAQTCGTCNGHGRVKTGSKKEGREVTDCEDCGGAGWHNLHKRPQMNGHTEAQTIAVSGPTVHGTEEPDPRALSLREEGWMVMPPISLGAGA